VALGAIAAIEIIFAARYPVPDQFMFMLPGYVMLAIGSAVGVARILEMRSRARRVLIAMVLASLAATPVLYGLAPVALERAGKSIRRGRTLPFRNENRYWLTPWKFNEDSADRFASTALDAAQGNAVILADSTTVYPLLLKQAQTAGRRDLSVQGSVYTQWSEFPADQPDRWQEFRHWLAGRPLYVVSAEKSYAPQPLLEQADLVQAWPLWMVQWR
jgi:hypothetical protein